MFVFPINRVPDETNHARMTWETFHKPTETSFKWMNEIPSNDKVKLAEYKQIFAQKIDMSKEPFQFGVSLKTISFIPQLIGMTIGSWISPTVGMIIYMGRIFNALAYILGIYFLIRYFKYGKTALMFISLLPIMVQQASSLSYDVMNYLEVMLALGFITNLAYSKRFTNRNIIQVIGLAILLLATKPNNVLLLGLIPFVPLEFEGVLAFLNRPAQAIKTFISKYKAVFYLEKGNYDAGVRNYGYMLENCDGAITSTNQLQEELYKYQSKVLLNRNLASDDLIAISSQYIKDYSQTSDIVKIGYFSGSISHNENFELIKPAIKQLLTKYSNVQLHIVGILDIPQDMKPFENQIVTQTLS